LRSLIALFQFELLGILADRQELLDGCGNTDIGNFAISTLATRAFNRQPGRVGIVQPLKSIVDIQPQIQSALLRLLGMISQPTRSLKTRSPSLAFVRPGR